MAIARKLAFSLANHIHFQDSHISTNLAPVSVSMVRTHGKNTGIVAGGTESVPQCLI